MDRGPITAKKFDGRILGLSDLLQWAPSRRATSDQLIALVLAQRLN